MIKPVEPKKILCIHDLSGVGRCSLAVILPVLSVMGLQPVALPTVVLSTHTGGLGTPARLDGCAYGEAALEHYHALGLDFDCIYTGYLGGEAQVALAEKAFALWPSAHKVVDPVMGDNGITIFTNPMDNHPRLRKSKWNEYTDSIKRNQPFRISSENKQKGNGTNCKCQDPIRVSHTCPFFKVHMRHVFIFRHIKGQHRKG